MKKNYFACLFILVCITSIKAQVSTVLSGFNCLDISIDGNDLYYTNGNRIFKADISDPDFPSVTLTFDADTSSDFDELDAITSIKVIGDNLYFADGSFLTGSNLYNLDLADMDASPILIYGIDPGHFIFSCEVQGAWVYIARLGFFGGYSTFARANTSGALPTTLSTYIDKETTALTISGGSMYFSESIYSGMYTDGEIYFKNMVLDLPEVSKFTANGIVHDLFLFEGLLYFTDDDGLKRINAALTMPTSELLVSHADHGELRKIEIKSYISGDKYLFVTEITNNRILKVDLTDPTLSTNNNDVTLVEVFPNPAEDKLTIKSPQHIKEITIYSLLGKRLKTLRLNTHEPQFDIDLSDLESAIYFVKITSEKGIHTQKLIKRQFY